MRHASLVLLSGGLDSAHAFVRAHEETDVLFAITFDYGQRARLQEIASAKKICARFDVAHKVIEFPFFRDLTNHPLLNDQKDCPTLTNAQLDSPLHTQKSANAVWLPNRNGIFLSLGAAMAEISLADRLYVGFNAEEGATFPDNSHAFVLAMNKALEFSTQNQVQVVAPAVKLQKSDIVRELVEHDFDLSQIWSCYLGDEKMCGRCESCLRFKRALMANDRMIEAKNLS